MAPTRRQFLLGTCAAAASITGCLGGSAPAGTPTNGPDPTRDGASDSPTPTDSTPSSKPGTTPKGDTPTDSPGDGTPPTSAPATSAVWRASFGTAVTTPPVATGDAVFAGSEGGELRRFDASSGSRDWSVDVSRPVQNLVFGGETVLAQCGTFELGSDQTVHALDAKSGEELWTFSPTNWWYDVLGVRGDAAYVATADDAIGGSGETLYALSLSNGDERWQAPIGDPREAVASADGVFVSSYGRVQGLDRDDGTERWDNRVREEVFTTLGVVDDTVVYAYRPENGDPYGVLVGVDAASGDERWRFDDWAVSSTVVGDGRVYVGGAGVAALDAADGEVRWESEKPGFLTDGSATADRLYAGGDSVQAYVPESGDLAWEWTPEPTQGGVMPAGVASSTLYLDAYQDADPRNRYKFAVDVETGDQRWAFEDGVGLTDLGVGADLAVAGAGNGRLYALQ